MRNPSGKDISPTVTGDVQRHGRLTKENHFVTVDILTKSWIREERQKNTTKTYIFVQRRRST